MRSPGYPVDATPGPARGYRRVPPTVGHLEPDGAHACVLHTGAQDLDALAGFVVMLGAGFEVLDPPDHADHIAALAARLTRATARR